MIFYVITLIIYHFKNINLFNRINKKLSKYLNVFILQKIYKNTKKIKLIIMKYVMSLILKHFEIILTKILKKLLLVKLFLIVQIYLIMSIIKKIKNLKLNKYWYSLIKNWLAKLKSCIFLKFGEIEIKINSSQEWYSISIFIINILNFKLLKICKFNFTTKYINQLVQANSVKKD